MEFLAVALLVLLQRYWSGPLPVSGSINVSGWLAIAGRLPGSETVIYLVSVFVPAAIVWLVSNSLQDTMLGVLYFLLCIGVLMACIHRVDIAVVFDQAHQELNRVGDEQDQTVLESRFSELGLVQQKQLHLDVTIYLFWCLLIGPAGAILCLFNRVFCDQLETDSYQKDGMGSVEGEPSSALPLKIQYWLEWPSARVNIMIMMLVGQFNTGWSIFTESLVDFQRDALHWLGLAYHAGVTRKGYDNLQDFKAQQLAYLEECEQFFNRQCLGWIGFAAVFAIFE